MSVYLDIEGFPQQLFTRLFSLNLLFLSQFPWEIHPQPKSILSCATR